jgi:hypothetical protein
MENYKSKDIDAEINAVRERFNENVTASYWSENGELVYVLQNGTDLEEYARLIEKILKHTSEPEMDFVCKLINLDEKSQVNIECKFARDESLISDGDIADEYDTLAYFKQFWNDEVSKKFNPEREVEFEVPEGVEIMKASRLIFSYINESTKLGQDITIVLKNISGGEERLWIPANS